MFIKLFEVIFLNIIKFIFIPIILLSSLGNTFSNVPNSEHTKNLVNRTIAKEKLNDFYVDYEELINTKDNWLGDGDVFIKIKVDGEIYEYIKNDSSWESPCEVDENKEYVLSILTYELGNSIIEIMKESYWKFENRTENIGEDNTIRNFTFTFFHSEENYIYVFQFDS
ncbi:hypothetical protein [Miniphocaeibacter halophilus]|uniref:Uncharacterized protein n=1 Tax=Miniphocaeibacter halophilus TaxID=2931922 RepID=A0AC61MTJ6_9FIRM|nr:hypothetical protein [Miniphocaeibacter halophilus]QQK08947.1 hypothetical protein JFY71_05265 [Miniphocaeibacter halophilus]